MSEQSQLARRSFLLKAGAGAAAVGATMGARPAAALAQSGAAGARWQPTMHAEDDWLDQLSGQHRFFFDNVSPTGFAEAIFFSRNFFTANRNGYGLEDSDLSVVICARHASTPFAFTDAMWAKYGRPLGQRAGFNDPKTGDTPTVNVFLSSEYGRSLPNNGVTLTTMLDRGVRLAVCQMATRAYAGRAARDLGGETDEIYAELVAHLVPNAHMVPAGIVTVNRAQEHGYAFAFTG